MTEVITHMITADVTDKELDILLKMSEKKDMSIPAIIKCAIRTYQSVDLCYAAGHIPFSEYYLMMNSTGVAKYTGDKDG